MPDEPLIYMDTPSFLKGTFHWMQRGYQFAHPPDIDLLSAEVLSAPDPWIVVAAVLERAKQGDFGSVSLLRKWAMVYNADPTLIAACVHLIAHAGSAKDLEWLATEMLDQTGWEQVRLVGAAQSSGQLFLVPFMVEARNLLDRQADRDMAEMYLRGLLDPLDDAALYADGCSNAEYERLVLARVDALIRQYGTDRIALLGGEPIDIWKMIAAMQALLTQRREPGKWLDWGNFLYWREPFETYTGVDCSRFYDAKGSFMPLNAAAALEKYAAREPRVEFEPGQRYFFGHRVPY